MATDHEVQSTIPEDARRNSAKRQAQNRRATGFKFSRRANEGQECFAWETVKSVANRSAFISPVAFKF
jgi:hypothetical protein